MPIQHGGDKDTTSDSLGLGQERSECYPTLETILGRIAKDWIKVVEGPRRFEDLKVVGTLPNLAQPWPGDPLGCSAQAESHELILCQTPKKRNPDSSGHDAVTGSTYPDAKSAPLNTLGESSVAKITADHETSGVEPR
jgi:hypothetical protein